MPKQQGHTGFSPKLREVKDAFPMPGKYHFRFKSPLIPGTDREKGAIAVWMDCVDNDQHVGVWRNTIVAKVTRINMDDEGEEDGDFMMAAPVAAPSPSYANGHGHGHGHAPSPAPVRRQTPAAAARRSAPSQPVPQPSPAPAAAEGDILGVFEEPAATGNLLDQGQPSSMTHGEGSLLDMTGGAYNNGNAPNSSNGTSSNHNDFMGMTATTVAAPVPAPVPAPIPAAPSSGNYGAGVGRPMSQQQQHQQQQKHVPQKVQAPRSGNAAGLSLNSSGPFGGLNWE